MYSALKEKPPSDDGVHPDCVDVGAGECSRVRRPFRHDWIARWANKSRQVIICDQAKVMAIASGVGNGGTRIIKGVGDCADLHE